MMIDVTRSTAVSSELAARIIADFRATMVQLKCASSERLLRMGVSMAQVNILYMLLRHGEMPMSRLADVLNVSLSSATGLIDRMEERGFIERTGVPEDRRIVLVRLTAQGSALLDELDAMTDELLRDVLGRLRPSQLGSVADATAALRAAVDATIGAPPAWIDRQPASPPNLPSRPTTSRPTMRRSTSTAAHATRRD